MPRKQLQNMQLPESGYNPIVFQGYTTEGPQYDTNILANSIGRLDTAIKEASDKQGAVNLALGEIRSQLNPEEYEWFDRYTRENYINPIQDEINAGNYGSAITLGTRLGTEAAKDFEFQDRARVNTEFNKWKEELKNRYQRGDIDNTTYKRALSENYYNYTPLYDDKGVNIGGNNWEATFDPVKDVSFTDVLDRLMKYQGTNQETTSYKGGTTQDFYKANGENVAIKSTTTGGSKTESLSEMTPEDWEKSLDNYLESMAGAEDALSLQQKYNNARWLLEQELEKATDNSLSEEERNIAIKKSEKLKKAVTDEDGGLLTPDMYVKNALMPMLTNMAYRKHTIATEAGDNLVDKSTLANRAFARSYFGSNSIAVDMYTMGYSIQYIEANAEDRERMKREGKAKRNEFSNDIVE